MKKNKRFLYDMENIPDRFLDEAENAPVVKKNIRWSTIISAAACFALICAVPAGISVIKHSHNNISGSPEVTSETGEVTEISEITEISEVSEAENEVVTDISEEVTDTEQVYSSVHITVESGKYLRDTARLLEDNGICDADRFTENFNRGSDEYNFISEVPVPDDNNKRFYRMEGYIMPGEYDFTVKENDDSEEYYNSISRVFYERTQETLTQEMRDRASALGMTMDEIMTLASIVERETSGDDPALMKNIASVFYNRLNSSDVFPALGSDPTREYEDYIINMISGETDSDQERAYDTFYIEGLPPGPICSPCEEAINAVLWPSETDYLYFCLNIETLETYFAETPEQHEANLMISAINPYEE